jgi:hypothetical protein
MSVFRPGKISRALVVVVVISSTLLLGAVSRRMNSNTESPNLTTKNKGTPPKAKKHDVVLSDWRHAGSNADSKAIVQNVNDVEMDGDDNSKKFKGEEESKDENDENMNNENMNVFLEEADPQAEIMIRHDQKEVQDKHNFQTHSKGKHPSNLSRMTPKFPEVTRNTPTFAEGQQNLSNNLMADYRPKKNRKVKN